MVLHTHSQDAVGGCVVKRWKAENGSSSGEAVPGGCGLEFKDLAVRPTARTNSAWLVSLLRHCFPCFTGIVWFCPHNNPMMCVLLLSQWEFKYFAHQHHKVSGGGGLLTQAGPLAERCSSRWNLEEGYRIFQTQSWQDLLEDRIWRRRDEDQRWYLGFGQLGGRWWGLPRCGSRRGGGG